jgi:hypothetical protein
MRSFPARRREPPRRRKRAARKIKKTACAKS